MHIFQVLLASIILLTCASRSPADERTNPKRKTVVEAYFPDGSTAAMTLLCDHLEIVSPYGKNKIPAEEIESIRFGRRYPEGVEKRIKAALEGLCAKGEREREKAASELLELRDYSWDAVSEAAKSPNEALAKAAEAVRSQILTPWSITNDEVTTTRGIPVVGQINLEQFKARTSYFGNVQVKFAAPKPADALPDDDSTADQVLDCDDRHSLYVKLLQTVEIDTRYGKLRVPAEEIMVIEFGFRYPAGMEQRVKTTIAGLGDADFHRREAASRELRELAEFAHPLLNEAVQSNDTEVAKRAEDLVKQIEAKVPVKRLKMPRHDLVVTKDATIIGRVEASHFKMRNEYLGDVAIDLGTVRRFRPWGSDDQTLSIDATIATARDSTVWKGTSVEMIKGMILKVTASGTARLMQMDSSAKECGPDGCRIVDKGDVAANQVNPVAPLPGTLIGRIGPNGTPFLLGSNYRGTSNEYGLLYIGIARGDWQNELAASYRVNIKASLP